MKVFCDFKTPGYFDYYIERYKNYPIDLYVDYTNITNLDKDRINIFLLHEPNEFFGIHTWVCHNYHHFHAIISWNKEVLNCCPNVIEFQCSWRENDNHAFEFLGEKKFEVSYLCGIKNLTEGHQLRQKIYTQLKDKIKIPNKWYY